MSAFPTVGEVTPAILEKAGKLLGKSVWYPGNMGGYWRGTVIAISLEGISIRRNSADGFTKVPWADVELRWFTKRHWDNNLPGKAKRRAQRKRSEKLRQKRWKEKRMLREVLWLVKSRGDRWMVVEQRSLCLQVESFPDEASARRWARQNKKKLVRHEARDGIVHDGTPVGAYISDHGPKGPPKPLPEPFSVHPAPTKR
jgi:hypothetical protein